MAGTSLGTTPAGMTPAVTPAASTADSERNAEFQEHEKILCTDFLSLAQITDLLEEDIAGIEKKLQIFLNFKNIQTSLKDAILLDYYVSGFLWAKEMDLSIDQYSKFMTLLYTILQNLQKLHMSLEDSIKWLGEVMAEIGPNRSGKDKDGHIFNIRQANAIVDYLKISLFQHYRLYEFLFHAAREEIVIGTEQTIEVVKPPNYPFPAPLEEGLSMDIYSAFIAPRPDLDVEARFLSQKQSSPEAQPEMDTTDVDPLVGFTIEDVKTALARVTEEVIMNVQTEITEKLQIQEEAFNARIEKLRKA